MEEWVVEHEIDDEMLEELLLLDRQAYEGKDIGDFNRCKNWLSKNKNIYTIVKHRGKAVGYINFLPITDEAYESFLNGEMKDSDLTENDILPFIKGQDLKCLFMSIVIKKEFRDGLAIQKLTDGFKEHLKKIKNEGVIITKIIQDCVSIDGIKFALNFFGSKYIRDSEGGKIYLTDLTVPRTIFPTNLRYEEINETNLKTAALIQYEIFKDTNSVGYLDYKNAIYPTERLNKKLLPLDFLVYWQDKPIGIVGLYSIRGHEEDIWVDWLGVLPEYRNRGFGTQMLIHIFETAKLYNKKNLRLFTFAKTYQQGVRIYKKIMQIMEPYKNMGDYRRWMKDIDCVVFSSSLCDKRASLWNNKFMNVKNEIVVHKKSLKLLKKDKLI